MAEATISHFREFPETERVEFKDRVKGAVAKWVYGVDNPDDIPSPDGVTVITHNLGIDSETDSPSFTEVKVDLDAEEWPVTDRGVRVSPEVLGRRHHRLAANIGQTLVGGVMREENAEVFVWVRQFPATGWYDGQGA